MITEVIIRNFKSCRDVEIKLERFTMFVGPNGSGKSSILKTLQLLCDAFTGGQGQKLEGVLRQHRSWGAVGQVELTACYRDTCFRFRTSSPSDSQRVLGRTTPDEDRLTYAMSGNDTWLPWGKSTNPPKPPQALLLRLETAKLVQAGVSSNPSAMAADGTGLHVALMNMTLNEPDVWQNLQEDLRRLIPTIRRLRHTRTDIQKPASLLFDTTGADSLLTIARPKAGSLA